MDYSNIYTSTGRGATTTANIDWTYATSNFLNTSTMERYPYRPETTYSNLGEFYKDYIKGWHQSQASILLKILEAVRISGNNPVFCI